MLYSVKPIGQARLEHSSRREIILYEANPMSGASSKNIDPPTLHM
jgi:hypothetical protein